jgi:titin
LDAITFNIPGGGVQSIALLSPLPSITSPVFIDGYTQPGASPNTLLTGDNAVLAIELNGASAGAGTRGFTINSSGSGSTVRGLVINRFGGDGIALEPASGNRIEGNFIGTNAAGNAALKNGQDGVQISQFGVPISGASNNTIGGPTAAARNIISGNGTLTSPPVPTNGVDIRGITSSGNVVQGNYIGTDATGSFAIPNLSQGVSINDAVNNLIVGNVSSGNGSVQDLGPPFGIVGFGNGVAIFSFSPGGGSGNQVQGNFLGTNASGTAAIPNINSGVSITGGSNNQIGGTTTAARNIISGNKVVGIVIDNLNTAGNLVQGNYIGTKANGTEALPNGGGVAIGGGGGGGSNNIIGGTAAGAGNLISGNIAHGVAIVNGSTGNLVQGNLIGTKANGTESLGNQGNGVTINNNASNNTIGGTASGARNVISGNVQRGINIGGGATGNSVQGNFIGTKANGTEPLGNGLTGVNIGGSGTGSGNTIGGTTPGAGNVISGNGTNGVVIQQPGSTGNRVLFNFIGTDLNGTIDLGNATNGVLIANGASSNTTVAANTIAFNHKVGVNVLSGTGNAIHQNSIFSNGGLGIDLGGDGVTPNDACDTDLGPNNFQNFPILNAVSSSGGNTTIQGTLNSTPNTTFTLEFFSNAAADPSGYGEGQTYIGSTTVTTGADCNATFVVTFADTPGEPIITATATDPGGNTSEFSGVLTNAADLSITKTDGQTSVVPGSQVTYTITVSNAGPSGVTGATVNDNFPASLSNVTWTCTASAGSSCGAATGSGNINTSVNLLTNGTATFTATGTLSRSATGTLDNTATVTPPAGVNDPNNANNSATDSDTITATSDLSLTKTGSPNPVTVGGTLTYTITVNNSGPSTATNVTLTDTLPASVTFASATPSQGSCTQSGGTVTCNLGSIADGGSAIVTITVTPNAAGTITNTATVSASESDPNSANNTATATTTVNKADTTTTVTSTQNPSSYGQSVTFTATVSSSGGTPSGTVQFYDNGSPLGGPQTLSGGSASVTTSSLSVGSHTITAQYSGDANFNGSTGTLTQVVNKANTTTTITSANPNPSVVGQPYTVSFTVAAQSPGSGTPTGTVTVSDGTGATCSGTLSGGSGSCQLTSTTAGAKTLTATYGGDSNFNSSSGTAAHQVNKADTTTSLTSSQNLSTYGQPVTFTATVTAVAPGGGTPTGTVTFKDGTTVLGTGTLNSSGQATFTTSSLFIGVHSITATYNGDANYNGSTSPPLIQTIVAPPSTEDVKVTGGGSISLTTGGSGTFGLVGKVSSADVPSGNVQYQDHDTGMNVNATTITSVVVTGTHAQMFGKATINGSGSYDFVVDVDDIAEPGINVDTFSIKLSNGYAAGPATLSGGNIQVHQ